MLNKYLVVLVSFAVLILLQKCIHGELYEGSRCVNTKNNKQHGTCKYLNDCPSALTLLRKKVYPQNCAFNKTNPIVCCFQTGSSALTNARNAGEISRQKCKEYNDNIKKQLEDFSTIAVAGGSLATKDQFPHMAAVGYKPKEQDEIQWSCGGSIISERFVLTAAHCLETKDLGTAKFILIGVIYLPDSVSGTQFNIKRAIPHPNYNSEAHYNDIALFELDKKIDISPSKRPVCLHTEHRIEEKNAIASGFGKLEFVQSTNSDHLYQVELEIYNRDECNKNYRNIPKLPNGIRDDVMVCAGHRTQFKDTCQGDSGGPLQICKKRTNNVCNNYEIIGVVSFGKACGLALNLPGVYTRVSGYTKWIEDNVWPN